MFVSTSHLALLSVFLPFFGVLITGVSFFIQDKKRRDHLSQLFTCSCMFIAALSALILFQRLNFPSAPETFSLLPWLDVGDLKIEWGLKLDSLSTLMLVMINSISFLIHLYATGYMSHDRSIPRFMGYLSLFTFMMLMLVTAPNLVQLFFGWEGVGLASYLLIGFWYERPAAGGAAMKAFLVNRVADIGLALGISGVFMLFQTVSFDQLFVALQTLGDHNRPLLTFWGTQWDGLSLIGLLLFIGAMGKSAQLGLHTWLPDAMEGPTPVSALIHAATMVTAGVFLLCRLSPLYELIPHIRDIIIFVGAMTALFAATVAITQTDIKRIIAYSTCSQLGYMIFAAGCSAYGAAMFHLIAHAFFKALLFLSAGSVIHAMSDEQDIRRMGGIYRLIPATYIFMWIGNIQLAAIPLFSLYQSKDIILESAYLLHGPLPQFAFYVGLIVAFLTALYSWRLLLLTFHGSPQADEKVMAHVHEAPLVMLIPLGFLALGAILIGPLCHNWFVGPEASHFWGAALVSSSLTHGTLPQWVIWSPAGMALSGILVAYLLYGRERTFVNSLAEKFSVLYRFSLHKWYIDEVYEALFVRPASCLGNIFWKWCDQKTIDRWGPDGLTRLSLFSSRLASRLQTGYVYHYAFAMIAGLVGLFLFQRQFWGN